MSRIPVPTHSPALSRPLDPAPPLPSMSPSTLSAGPSLSETRKKQSKRDEVRLSASLFPSNPPAGNPQENRIRTCPEAHYLDHLPVRPQQTSGQAGSGQGYSRRPQAQPRPHRPGEHHRRRSQPAMCCQAHRLCPRRRRRRRPQRHIHRQGLGVQSMSPSCLPLTRTDHLHRSLQRVSILTRHPSALS